MAILALPAAGFTSFNLSGLVPRPFRFLDFFISNYFGRIKGRIKLPEKQDPLSFSYGTL
jgi:hypothetical protein